MGGNKNAFILIITAVYTGQAAKLETDKNSKGKHLKLQIFSFRCSWENKK